MQVDIRLGDRTENESNHNILKSKKVVDPTGYDLTEKRMWRPDWRDQDTKGMGFLEGCHVPRNTCYKTI